MMINTGGNGTGLNDYFPILSNYGFGNNILANLGGSSAFLSGSFTPQQNFNIAQFEPITFPPLPHAPAQQIGDMNLPNQILPPGQRPMDQAPAGPADPTGENRIVHFFKLQFVALVALALLAIGLYLLSQQTEAGRAVKGKVVETAKTAGEAAAMA